MKALRHFAPRRSEEDDMLMMLMVFAQVTVVDEQVFCNQGSCQQVANGFYDYAYGMDQALVDNDTWEKYIDATVLDSALVVVDGRQSSKQNLMAVPPSWSDVNYLEINYDRRNIHILNDNTIVEMASRCVLYIDDGFRGYFQTQSKTMWVKKGQYWIAVWTMIENQLPTTCGY